MRIVKRIFLITTFCMTFFYSDHDAQAMDDFTTYYAMNLRLNPNRLIYYAQTYINQAQEAVDNIKLYCGFNLYNQAIANELMESYTRKTIVNGGEKIFIDIADRLYKAAACNDLYALSEVIDTVNYLVQNGEIENALSTEGIRFLGADSLHIACEKGYPRIVERLLRADIFMGVEKNNQRPLHVACHLGYYDVAEVLLRHSEANLATINALNKAGQTPLDLVAENRHDLVNLLEGYGVAKAQKI